jgi:hypothetical protein
LITSFKKSSTENFRSKKETETTNLIEYNDEKDRTRKESHVQQFYPAIQKRRKIKLDPH